MEGMSDEGMEKEMKHAVVSAYHWVFGKIVEEAIKQRDARSACGNGEVVDRESLMMDWKKEAGE